MRDKLSARLKPNSLAASLGACAVLSALLTTYLLFDPWGLLQIGLPSQEAIVPILPGIYFGLVICAGVYFIERINLLRAFVLLVLIIFAWMVAFETAVQVDISVRRYISGSNDAAAFLLPGLLAGFIGSMLTSVAVSLVSPNFRYAKAWIRTIAIGMFAGLLLDEQYILNQLAPLFGAEGHYLLKNNGDLFIVWQPAVAASVAYGLATAKRERFKQSAHQKEQVDHVAQLTKLAKLHAEGILTEEEFKNLKGNIIGAVLSRKRTA